MDMRLTGLGTTAMVERGIDVEAKRALAEVVEVELERALVTEAFEVETR